MSTENYKKALELIQNNKQICFFAGERDILLIEKAEEFLDLKFSTITKDFFTKFGAGSIGAQEVYGITSDNFQESSIPNGVWLTSIERSEVDMPKHLFVISDNGYGEFYCLDYSNLSSIEEPRVVVYVPGVDNNLQSYEVIAEDFGDYLLSVVESELE